LVHRLAAEVASRADLAVAETSCTEAKAYHSVIIMTCCMRAASLREPNRPHHHAHLAVFFQVQGHITPLTLSSRTSAVAKAMSVPRLSWTL
jgi:hypothetical protein